MDEGLAALLGALIGGSTTWATTWAVELRRERRLAKSVAVAAASELDAMIRLASARGFPQGVKAAHEQALAGVVVHVDAHVREDYLPLCRAALAHAGAIDTELATLLARAIVLSDSLTSDFRRLSAFPPGEPGSLLNSPEDAARVYGDLVEIFDAVYAVGAEVVALVGGAYPPKHSFLARAPWRRMYVILSLAILLASAAWLWTNRPTYGESLTRAVADCESRNFYSEAARSSSGGVGGQAPREVGADALARDRAGMFDDLIPSEQNSAGIDHCSPEATSGAATAEFEAAERRWRMEAGGLIALLIAMLALGYLSLRAIAKRQQRAQTQRD